MNKNTIAWLIGALVVLFGLYVIFTSKSSNEKEIDTLVTRYCGRCHHVPNPNSLTKIIWEKNIMRQMSEYYKWSERSRFHYANRSFYLETGTIPMTDTIWSTLQSYFVDGGLDEPYERSSEDLEIQNNFEVIPINSTFKGRGITAVSIDKYNRQVVAGHDSTLLWYSESGEQLDSQNTKGLISGIFLIDKDFGYLLDPGVLDPHDQSLGSLKKWNRSTDQLNIIKKDLARPVYLNQAEDLLFISEYGNEKGQLSELNVVDNKYDAVSNLPGSYKSIIFDYDKDGNDEIIVMFAQALEGVYVREVDRKDKSFVPLLSFVPEWGISDIDTADVNQDGWTDLIVVNGDNADYSMIPKAYHGLRIYLNDKEGRFAEAYNYPLHGATQVQALDANGDGLDDILVGSFFALNKEDRLILLINNGGLKEISYTARRFEEANLGRWMVMNKGDVDGDGDLDAIIGSFEIEQSIKKGEKDQADLLLLLNQSNK